MCGIAGELNFNQRRFPEDVYLSMRRTLKKRGPDQDGIFMNDSAALVHTRLAIVDLEHGRQPMIETVNGQQIVLVYNGELYNTEEIRKDLLRCGWSFRGHSDTEVVLKSYLEFGTQCVERMNGIFAFAILDERFQTLFVARDRMGVKPLFYYLDHECFLFGSEIKALLAHPSVEPIITRASLKELICIGPGRTPGQAIFKGIQELLPGECGIVHEGKLKLWKYWELKDRPWIYDFETTKALVRKTVTDAIERQLVSDVPVCTFLSGGLDSSLISAIAARKYKENGKVLDTISVEYAENEKFFKPSFFQPNRDDHYVQVMVDAIGSCHHSVILDNQDLALALYDAVEARDLPGMVDVDSSLLLFCRKIKEIASVALSGECADEIFGGYPWFRDPRVLNSPYFPWSGDLFNRMSYLREEFRNFDAGQYVLERVEQTRHLAEKLPFNTPEQRKMKEMMRLNLDWFMQTLLERKDRMSMASGLEVRVPFCDWRLVEMLYHIPWEMKNWQGREKGLLREAFCDWLPEEITWRKKSPYPKTHHPLYTAQVRRMLQEILDDPSSPLLQFVDSSRLQQLLQEETAIPWYGQLMLTPQTMAYFVQINYWLKHYHIRFEDCE